MNTKVFAMSIAFAVVAMILNPAITGIKIPSPFLTGLYYQVWDIPILIAFFLLGFKYGVFAGVLNSLFLFAVFPGPSQPFYAPSNVVSQFSMMIGIFLAIKFFVRGRSAKKSVSRIKLVLTSTVLGILVRIPVMLAIMFLILRYFMGLTESIAFAALFAQIFYIIITVSYTIPVAFVIARTVNKNLKVGNQLSKDPSTISSFYLVS